MDYLCSFCIQLENDVDRFGHTRGILEVNSLAPKKGCGS